MKSPKNKMLSSDDMDTKGIDINESANAPFEVTHETESFWLPKFSISVKAKTLAQAIEIAEKESHKQS